MTEGEANPIIRGERCWIRAFEEADIAAYRSAVNDANVAFWAGYEFPQNEALVRSFYEKRACGDEYHFVISPLGGRDFLGTIWLWNLNGRLGGAELSMFLAGELGRGVGSDAVNAMLDFAFGTLDVHRVWLTTFASNERSQRAFARAGFRQEGVVRGHAVRRGKWVDSVQMSILRPDWEALDRPRSWDRWTIE